MRFILPVLIFPYYFHDILEMSTLWSSFVGYLCGRETPSVPVKPSSGGREKEAEALVLEFMEIYGKLKGMKSLKPCDELDSLFGRLVNLCIANRDSGITNQVCRKSL